MYHEIQMLAGRIQQLQSAGSEPGAEGGAHRAWQWLFAPVARRYGFHVHV